MQISVIIPTLNEEAHIGPTIDRLLRYGSGRLAEILVVDGGSTDATLGQAEAHGARVLSSVQRSRAAQMNLGAENSQSPILYFVHADTIVPETFAEDISASLDKGRPMGCFRYRFDSKRWLLRFNAYFTRFPFLFCQGGDKTFYIRRELFFQLGQYDTRCIIMEEYDFLRRAGRQGYRLAVLPRYCVVSARKYEKNSWLRVQLVNAVVFNSWAWGIAGPERLKAIYRRWLRW